MYAPPTLELIKRLAALLAHQTPSKQIAAAVVLGELKIRDPVVVTGLCKMAHEGGEALAVAAIDALGSIGSGRALPVLLECLGRGGEISKAAGRALAALGSEAIPAIKTRMEDAPNAERAALSEVLAAVGGRESFDILLRGLYDQDYEAVQRTALAVRQEMRRSPDKDRLAILRQVEKFLSISKTQKSETASRAALKILGYLEEQKAVPILLKYIRKGLPPTVRAEAVAALRFPLSRMKDPGQGIAKILPLLEDSELPVSRSARETLTTLRIPAAAAGQLIRLAQGPNQEVAHFAIQRLGEVGGTVAEKGLAGLAAIAEQPTRAEEIAKALSRLEKGPTALTRALLKAKSEIMAVALSNALAPLAGRLSPLEVKGLTKAGLQRLGENLVIGAALIDPAREVNALAWIDVLRGAVQKVARKGPDKVAELFAAVARPPRASPDQRYALARLFLSQAPKNPSSSARSHDPILKLLETLLDDGYPLAKALTTDRSLNDEERYYLGIHFVERSAPEAKSLGGRLLESLADRAPRSKLAKNARTKLSLAGTR